VFTESATGWKQVAELTGSDTVSGDGFGVSVAVSGAIVVIGASGYSKNAGRAYVFIEAATGWKQVAELKASDTVAEEVFGSSVAVSGTTAITGAYFYA
jgi:nucleoside-specific outer membrane channel protein Tsx